MSEIKKAEELVLEIRAKRPRIGGMGLIQCPDCGGQVSDSAHTCPHCGKPAPFEATTTTINYVPPVYPTQAQTPPIPKAEPTPNINKDGKTKIGRMWFTVWAVLLSAPIPNLANKVAYDPSIELPEFVAFVFLLIARSFIIAFRCRDASLHPAPSIIISFLPILSWIILIRLAIKPSEPIEPRN